MAALYIVGGVERERHSPDEWTMFEKGRIVRIDLDTKNAGVVFDYVTPPSACADGEPAILFKAASLHDGRLHLCTQTEILRFDLATNRVTDYVSLPLFNDVHHVLPDPVDPLGRVYVANTGLDSVLLVGWDGHVIKEFSLTGEPRQRRFQDGCDYRKVLSTKPHAVHPNFLFEAIGGIWVTRFETRDAVALGNLGDRIPIDIEGPHDGVINGDLVYFTTVDGQIVGADAQTRTVCRIIDLRKAARAKHPLGWCRGLSFLGPDLCAVGFTRLRRTREPGKIAWVRDSMKQAIKDIVTSPTRVAVYDLKRERLVEELAVEGCGLSAIFSIHLADA